MTATPHTPRRIAIFMFDGVEALDFAGPFEVFTTASRMRAREGASVVPPFEVRTVSRDGGTAQARAGLRVHIDHAFADAPPCDVLLVPGGVVDAALACPATLAWLARTGASCEIVASVCTGAFLLAAAGLAQGQPLTTHWEDIAALREAWPGGTVVDGVRWVGPGRVLSSAGIASGIDMSLHLVERLAGRALAERTARQMEVRWMDSP